MQCGLLSLIPVAMQLSKLSTGVAHTISYCSTNAFAL